MDAQTIQENDDYPKFQSDKMKYNFKFIYIVSTIN